MVSFHSNGTVTVTKITGHQTCDSPQIHQIKYEKNNEKNCSLTKKEKGVAGRIYYVVIGLTVYT